MKPEGIPLLIVTGASGSGKTFLARRVRELLPGVVVFDIDDMLGNEWQTKKANWLRVVYFIGMSGINAVLFGTITRKQLQACDYLEKFASTHVANLHCDDEVRANRLRARGADENTIQYQLGIAKALIEEKEPDVFGSEYELIPSNSEPEKTAVAISEWARRNLSAHRADERLEA